MHRARIEWVEPESRGKRSLPATLRYVGIGRFDEDGPSWPDGAWSVEVLFEVPPPEQRSADVSDAHVRFLVDEAPQEKMREGARFGLYEGPTKVADVEVVD